MDCKIRFLWDNEAAVWVATSEDVPGLVLESGSFDVLVEKVRHAIPELLELNRKSERHKQVFIVDRSFHTSLIG